MEGDVLAVAAAHSTGDQRVGIATWHQRAIGAVVRSRKATSRGARPAARPGGSVCCRPVPPATLATARVGPADCLNDGFGQQRVARRLTIEHAGIDGIGWQRHLGAAEMLSVGEARVGAGGPCGSRSPTRSARPCSPPKSAPRSVPRAPITMVKGMPCASVNRLRLPPCLPRTLGLVLALLSLPKKPWSRYRPCQGKRAHRKNSS